MKKFINAGVLAAAVIFGVQSLASSNPITNNLTTGTVSSAELTATPGFEGDAVLGERVDKGLLFSPARLLGPGGNSIGIQAFALDERTRDLFTLQLNGAKSGNQSTVNRTPFDGSIKRNSVGHSQPVSDDVGHQGLGIEYLNDGGFRLWTTARLDTRQAVRYSYADGSPLARVELYKLFGKNFKNRSSSTPTISRDQKYLIAIGLRKRASTLTVRIWRLADIINGGPGDYSDSWLYEWDAQGLIDSTHPTQGVASDGEVVWLVSGNNDIDVSKRLQSYTLNGSIIFSNENLNIGRAQALLDGSGSVYEPEGLAFFNINNRIVLCIGIVSGDLGARRTRIYEIKKDEY